MGILTEALLKQISSLDMPILILPQKKKKATEEEEIDEIGSRLSEPGTIAGGGSMRIPSASPG